MEISIDPIYIVLLLSIITLVYNVNRNYHVDRRSPNHQLISYLSKIKIDKKMIIDISSGEKEDKLQIFEDEILIRHRNQKRSEFNQLVKLYDSKLEDALKSSFIETSPIEITNYFSNHYRYLIIELTKKQADDKTMESILNSYSKNSDILLDLLDRDTQTYIEENKVISNNYVDFIMISVEYKNNAAFSRCIELFFESFKSSMEKNYSDSDIMVSYIVNFNRITKYTCEEYFNVGLLASFLHKTGSILLRNKYYTSFNMLLNTFENIITSSLNIHDIGMLEPDGINHVKTNLMVTVRALISFMSNTEFDLQEEYYIKIEKIILQNLSNTFYMNEIYHAVEKLSRGYKQNSESALKVSEICDKYMKLQAETLWNNKSANIDN
ncbi:hypothetical protein [Methanolobus sp. WCC4]|uniref:hypothetical protein n=1 Tax=Methanolobus sp. WCC4 TaxID=3125784 RepID=UPI0030F71EBF